MRTKKNEIQNQRSIIERRLKPWLKLRLDKVPPSGWIKAIRGSLGMNTRQLADHLNVDHSAVVKMETREKHKKITLELLDKAADAMGCKLVYAIVPKDEFNSLDNIIDKRAQIVAREIIKRVEHNMQLESQGQPYAQVKKQIKDLATELKKQMDSRLWEVKK